MNEKPLSQRVFEENVDASADNWEEIQVKLMTTIEELLPELKAAIRGNMIHHPLVVGFAQQNAHANFLLLVRRKQIEEAERENDWFKYVFTHERPYQVEAFKSAAAKMDDESYWKTLADVYVESENLRQNQGAIRRLLTADRPHREALMSDEERTVIDGLPETVTIFRGYCFDNSHGWSWTISREKAEWFGNRFAKELGGIPRIATGKVKKTDIIAYFDGREEKEIVCDPKSVADITTERLDGKQDRPRIPREDKLEFDSFSEVLKMHMKQNLTMTLSEMRSALDFMDEEVNTLIEHHGEETLCRDINKESVDSTLLQNEFKEIGDTEIGDVPGNIEDAYQDVEELIEEHNGEALCGDFDLS
jgi:hypothetical protein